VTDDESFVDELRITLRFFASVLVRRIHKVHMFTVRNLEFYHYGNLGFSLIVDVFIFIFYFRLKVDQSLLVPLSGWLPLIYIFF
jgi:hypothetical protein